MVKRRAEKAIEMKSKQRQEVQKRKQNLTKAMPAETQPKRKSQSAKKHNLWTPEQKSRLIKGLRNHGVVWDKIYALLPEHT